MTAPRWLRRLDRRLMELIYPGGVVCLACGRPSHGRALCGDCAQALERDRMRDEAADSCGEGMPFPFHAAYFHQGVARTLVHRLKYSALEDAAQVLAEPMAEIARAMNLPPDTVVTWVAMPKGRRRERGVDHGRLLARAVADRLALPAAGLLERTGEATHTQEGLNRRERLENLSAAFACPGPAPEHVLLVDDVMTTGATACACVRCLENSGARYVAVLTATRTIR